MMMCAPPNCIVASPYAVVAPSSVESAPDVLKTYPAAAIADPLVPPLPEHILSEALQKPKLQRILDEQAQETEAPSDDDDEHFILGKEIKAAQIGLHAARQRKFELLCDEEAWLSVEGMTANLKVQIQELLQCREAVGLELKSRKSASDRVLLELESSAIDLRRRYSVVDEQDVKNSEMLAHLTAKVGALSHELDALQRVDMAKAALKDLRQAVDSGRQQKAQAEAAAETAAALLAQTRDSQKVLSSPCRDAIEHITELLCSVEKAAQMEVDQMQRTQDLRRKSELLEQLCDWHRQHPEDDDWDLDEEWNSDNEGDEAVHLNHDMDMVEATQEVLTEPCAEADQLDDSGNGAALVFLSLAHIGPLLASWLVSAWWLCLS